MELIRSIALAEAYLAGFAIVLAAVCCGWLWIADLADGLVARHYTNG